MPFDRKKKKWFLFFTSFCVCHSPLVGDTFTWTPANNTWFTPSNWNPNTGVPQAGDLAVLGAAATTIPPVLASNGVFAPSISLTVADTVTLAASGTGSFRINNSNFIVTADNTSCTGFNLNFSSGSITFFAGTGLTQFDFSNNVVDAAISVDIDQIEPGTTGLDFIGNGTQTITATVNFNTISGSNDFVRFNDVNGSMSIDTYAAMSSSSILLPSSIDRPTHLTFTTSGGDATADSDILGSPFNTQGIEVDIGAGNTLSTSGTMEYIEDIAITTGNLEFTAADAYPHDITVAASQALIYNNATATPFSRLDTVTGDGFMQKLGTGTVSTTKPININSSLQLQAGTLLLSSDALASTGAFLLTAGATLELSVASGTADFSAGLDGAGIIKKSGDGTLTWSSSSNLNTGTIDVSAGILTINDSAINTSSIVDVTGHVNFNMNTTSKEITAVITGDGSIQKSGANTLTLSGANDYLASTTISTGKLILKNAACAGVSQIVNSSVSTESLTFDLSDQAREYSGAISGDGEVFIAGSANAEMLTLSGNNSIGSGGLTVDTDAHLTLKGVAIANSTGIVNSGELVFDLQDGTDRSNSSAIGGNGTFEKLGSASLTMSGALDYTGITTLNSGFLLLDNDAAALNSNTSVATGSTLILNVNDGTDREFTGSITGLGALIKNGADALTLTNTSIDYTGTTTINAGTLALKDANIETFASTVSFGATNTFLGFEVGIAADRTFSAAIDGSGGVRKLGAGQLSLTGNNSFNGSTQVEVGTLVLNNTSINSNSDIAISAGAELDFNINTTSATYSGALSGTGTLVKIGDNTVILDASSSFTGSTRIDSGVIRYSGLAGTSSSAVELNGATTVVVFLTNGQNPVYSGVISGSGIVSAVSSDASETIQLTGANTYTGNTTIASSSILSLKNAAADGVSNVAVSSGGTLFFITDTNNDREYTGDISNSGTVLYNGSVDGTLTLSGTNTYAGTTSLTSSSTLTFTNSGLSENTSQIGMGTGATARFNITSTTKSFSNPITGPGNVTKIGAAQLTLSGANTYSQTTTISAGTLLLQNAAVNSNSAITNNASLSFNVTDQPREYSNDIEGTGSVGVLGTQELTLSGSNTYTGGTSVGGKLIVEGLNALPEGNGLFNNNGTITFNIAGTETYSGNISGSGTYFKTNSGTLTLDGSNTLPGDTFTISAGNLQGDVDALDEAAFDIDNTDSTLILAEATDQTIGFTTTGTGKFIKLGAGEVTLNTTLAHLGTTTLSAGTLNVGATGDISSSAMTVAAGATLKGTGSVSDVTNNGTIAPGASIGTLTINGDFVHSNTATFELELNTSTSDILIVTGSAEVQGGTLQIIPSTGVYRTGTTYPFIQATTTATGAFDTIVDDNAFLMFTVSIVGKNFVATVRDNRVILPIATSSLRGNSKRASDYLFANNFTPISNAMGDAYNILTNQPLKYYIDDLVKTTPLIYSALHQVGLQNNVRVAQAMTKRFLDYCPIIKTKNQKLRAKRAKRREQKRLMGRGKYYSHVPEQAQLYVTPLYFFYNQQFSQGEIANKGQPGFKDNTYGVAFGWQKSLKDNLVFEISGGYTHSSILWLKGLGHGKGNAFYLGPLIGMTWDKYFFDILFMGAYNYYHVKRRIKFATFEEVANYRNQSYDVLLRFDGGRLFRLQKHLSLEMDGQLNFVSMLSPAVSETDATVFALHIKKNNTLYIQPNYKLRLIGDIFTSKFCLMPNIYLGWLANIPLSNGMMTSRFVGEQTNRRRMKTKGYKTITNQMVSGAELFIKNEDSFNAAIGFEWSTFSKLQIYQTQLRVEWSF